MLENTNKRQRILPDIHLEQVGKAGSGESWVNCAGGDLGNGSYRNYIIYSDYSDPDVIRVGEDYYMISSTFHFNPGITILHSKDMVNWELTGHVIDDLSKLHRDFSFRAMGGYGDGIWAPSLRYHEGRFYVHVGGPKIGLICCSAENIEGPWTVKRMRFPEPWEGGMLIDCCPLWDDDGTAYFAAAEPKWLPNWEAADYKIHLFRMSEDGTELLDTGTVIHGGRTTEAVKLYKIGEYYYIMYREHPWDEDGRGTQFAARAKNIYGPYERRKLLHSHDPETDMMPSQGGLLDTPDGRWYFVCHGMNNDIGRAAIGRPVMLLPVTWKEGWPVIGRDIDGDGVGEMVWEDEKPVQGMEICRPGTGDDFSGPDLQPQWQWNHAPRNDMWSLKERPGYLRLKAAVPVRDGGFYNACNTLTQRLVGEQSAYTVRMSLEGLEDGQFSGMCLMTKKSRLLGIYRENGRNYLRKQYTVRYNEAIVKKGINDPYCDDFFTEDLCEVKETSIWLRCECDRNKGRMLYSLDGTDFREVQGEFEIGFSEWRGGRTGIFTWNDYKEEGYADFAEFEAEVRA